MIDCLATICFLMAKQRVKDTSTDEVVAQKQNYRQSNVDFYQSSERTGPVIQHNTIFNTGHTLLQYSII